MHDGSAQQLFPACVLDPLLPVIPGKAARLHGVPVGCVTTHCAPGGAVADGDGLADVAEGDGDGTGVVALGDGDGEPPPVTGHDTGCCDGHANGEARLTCVNW